MNKIETFEAKVENLDNVLDFIGDTLRDNNIDNGFISKVCLVSEEIFTNIAFYAYKGKEGTAKVGVNIEDDTLTIQFVDSGVKFNPLDKDDPNIDGNAESRQIGGLGIYLVKTIMDDVDYKYEDNQNVLTLTKKFELVKNTIQDGICTICLSGKLDTNNYAQIEKNIQEFLNGKTFDKLVLDFDNLNYVSSSGLRVILRLKKTYDNMEVINVGSEVYDVLEMTGFTEMIKITKAYRKLSVEGLPIVGKGAKGTVYRYNQDTIVKVFNHPDSLEGIHKERRLAKEAFILGIPTAISYDVVRVGNLYGSVFELLESKSLGQMLVSDPDNFNKYADTYTDLIKNVHTTLAKPGSMPSVKNKVFGWVNFLEGKIKPELFQKFKDMVNAVPDVGTILHMDYHTSNVLISNGEFLIIDMDTLCTGHPIFELGCIKSTYINFCDFQGNCDFLGLPMQMSIDLYNYFIERYFGGKISQDIQDKIDLIASARSVRHFGKQNLYPEMVQKEIENIERLLSKLDRIDY